jgi:hypothetical protein
MTLRSENTASPSRGFGGIDLLQTNRLIDVVVVSNGFSKWSDTITLSVDGGPPESFAAADAGSVNGAMQILGHVDAEQISRIVSIFEVGQDAIVSAGGRLYTVPITGFSKAWRAFGQCQREKWGAPPC